MCHVTAMSTRYWDVNTGFQSGLNFSRLLTLSFNWPVQPYQATKFDQAFWLSTKCLDFAAYNVRYELIEWCAKNANQREKSQSTEFNERIARRIQWLRTVGKWVYPLKPNKSQKTKTNGYQFRTSLSSDGSIYMISLPVVNQYKGQYITVK